MALLRRPRPLALLIAAIPACTSSTGHPPPTVRTHAGGRTAAAAPARRAATPPVAVPAPLATDRAETAAPDFEREWAWIQSEFPEARMYRPGSRAEPLLAELFAWVPPGTNVTAYDRACRPIVLHRTEHNRALSGRVHEQTSRSGRNVSRWHKEVVFDLGVMVTCGSTESFLRAPDGTLMPTTSSGYGCARRVGRALSRVTPDAVLYDAHVRLDVACVHRIESTEPCEAGGRRTCSGCRAWGLHASSPASMGSSVQVTRVGVIGASDCSAPCRAVEAPASVVRARRALEGARDMRFLRDGLDAHPLLFRTRRACQRYQRAHRMRADERETW